MNKHTILGHDDTKTNLKVAIDMSMPVLLVGDTGTGKTTIVKDIADDYGKQWIRFNLTGETTVDEFVGKYVLEDKSTKWEDGILLTAMKQGYWLIVDEINVALPEILFVLHSLLDDERAVMVANHLGEVVKPHPEFRFFGTMNPVDEYAGTKDLNKAFKSRFGMILNMGYPEAKVEAEVVAAKGGVDSETASKIVDTGVLIRKAKLANKVYYTCSTRDLIQWASLVDTLGIKTAFEVAVLSKANGDHDKVVQIFSDTVQTYTEAAKQGFKLNYDYYQEEHTKLESAKAEFAKSRDVVREELKAQVIKALGGNEDNALIDALGIAPTVTTKPVKKVAKKRVTTRKKK